MTDLLQLWYHQIVYHILTYIDGVIDDVYVKIDDVKQVFIKGLVVRRDI